MSKTKEIEEWITKATEDLETAKVILESKAPSWAACFHCQQSAEKILKTAQIYFFDNYQKEHDLGVLANTLIKYIDLTIIKSELKRLEKYYVGTRYPGLDSYQINSNDAKISFTDAKKIFKYIKKELK